MQKTPISHIPDLPEQLREAARGTIYDSSCSRAARVYYIDQDGGYYLKTAPAGTLRREKEMTEFFAHRGMGAQVVEYLPLDRDWLLTRAVKGDDCIADKYLLQPQKLCDTLAEIMVQLHSLPTADCIDTHRTEEYLRAVEDGYRRGKFDGEGLDSLGIRDAEAAFRLICDNRGMLEHNTLIHGDFCLPNIMLDDWRFSGFIDLDHAGVGDRHIDIYWVLWSLKYNLKTDRYAGRFMDAYGRDKIDPHMLRIIAACEAFG